MNASASTDAPRVDTSQIYGELRRIARRERASGGTPTLNTTSLVHEAWLKLNGKLDRSMSKEQYLATAATSMRQILIDYARYRHARKRDVTCQVNLSLVSSDNRKNEADPDHVDHEAMICLLGGDSEQTTIAELLALDQAIERLQSLDPELAQFVELRFFAGLTLEELAQVRGVTVRTATRAWARARALLRVWMASS